MVTAESTRHDLSYWQGARYRQDESRGHYGTWFLRANHPTRKVALKRGDFGLWSKTGHEVRSGLGSEVLFMPTVEVSDEGAVRQEVRIHSSRPEGWQDIRAH